MSAPRFWLVQALGSLGIALVLALLGVPVGRSVLVLFGWLLVVFILDAVLNVRRDVAAYVSTGLKPAGPVTTLRPRHRAPVAGWTGEDSCERYDQDSSEVAR